MDSSNSLGILMRPSIILLLLHMDKGMGHSTKSGHHIILLTIVMFVVTISSHTIIDYDHNNPGRRIMTVVAGYLVVIVTM